jgi:hypothetical protein
VINTPRLRYSNCKERWMKVMQCSVVMVVKVIGAARVRSTNRSFPNLQGHSGRRQWSEVLQLWCILMLHYNQTLIQRTLTFRATEGSGNYCKSAVALAWMVVVFNSEELYVYRCEVTVYRWKSYRPQLEYHLLNSPFVWVPLYFDK